MSALFAKIYLSHKYLEFLYPFLDRILVLGYYANSTDPV